MKKSKWKEVYAAIYTPTCDKCGKCDTGWFFILNGMHSNGTVCSKCHKGTRAIQATTKGTP